MEKEPMTRVGYEKITGELDFFKSKERPETVIALDEARQLGDLKENAEYHAAREELSMIESKIQELQGRISRARIISEDDIGTDSVHILTKVKLKDLKFEDILEYKLVSATEANYKENKISVESPMGKALIGEGVGKIVEVPAPGGVMKYEILEISR